MKVKTKSVLALLFGFLTLIVSIDSMNNLSINKGACNSMLARSSTINCSDYYYAYPYTDKQWLNKDCSLHFTPDSKEYFTYKVTKFKYRFVNLKIHLCDYKSTTEYTRCVIQPMEWVWTFGGVGGGEQYLEWPTEYETLSMGMLQKFTSPPLHVNVTVRGKCNIVVGDKNTTERFALAFADFYHELAMLEDQYNYSYWCFKTRIYIPSNFLYTLCKQVICPVETIGYKCCKQIFDVNTRNNTIICVGDSFKFGSVWWICPFVIGVLLYLYSALIFAWIQSNFSKHLDSGGTDNDFMDLDTSGKENGLQNERTPLLQEPESQTVLWINHNPVTVLSILVGPIRRFYLFYPVSTSRFVRCLLAILSLTVIFIKVSLHYIYHRDFIIESVKQGAPKDFLSVIAGYEKSKDNFLIFLGGPFVALGAYISCFLIFISSPRDLAEWLESGLPANNAEASSPLILDLKIRERFGSKRVVCSNYRGYTKIHHTMLANIFALLNPCFYGYILTFQISRFKYFANRMNQNVCTVIFVLFVAMLYFATCILELLLVIACFGFPTIFGITIVFRSYITNLYTWLRDKGSVGICMMFLILPCVIVMLMITIYMFSIIFVDSFIFMAKVAIFTYTGLFVNPSYTEGWVIFGITIIMYIYDSIHSVNDTYEQLFVQTKKVCKRKGKKLHISQRLYKKEVEGAAIPRDLYKYVIQSYKPIRVEVFIAFVKISIIVFCLYISLGILVNFDGFQELNVVTQTASTIFVSFLPKLLKRMCSLNERRKILRMRIKIDEVVNNYLIYRGIDMEQEILLDNYPRYDMI